jgi:hypothetical protein
VDGGARRIGIGIGTVTRAGDDAIGGNATGCRPAAGAGTGVGDGDTVDAGALLSTTTLGATGAAAGSRFRMM